MSELSFESLLISLHLTNMIRFFRVKRKAKLAKMGHLGGYLIREDEVVDKKGTRRWKIQYEGDPPH